MAEYSASHFILSSSDLWLIHPCIVGIETDCSEPDRLVRLTEQSKAWDVYTPFLVVVFAVVYTGCLHSD